MLSSELRGLRLGQIFAAGIPLGPFQALPLSCFRSSSGLGRFHGGADCGQLRSAPAVERAEVPLTLAVEELCPHCAWPIPGDHPLVAFAEAVSSLTSLTAWVDAAGDEAEFPAGSVMLPVGRAESDVARDGQRRRWLRLQAQLLESHTVAAAYPWLASWAEPMRAALEEAVDCARRSLASLLDEAALLEAACAATLSSPGVHEGPAVVGPGPSGSLLVQDAWARWRHECAAGWDGLEVGRAAAMAVVYGAFGSRRRGRTGALDALDHLVDDWNARARALAAQHAEVPCRSVAVDLPPLDRVHGDEGSEDGLTRWEAGVLAVYQVVVHWSAGTVDLLVPGPVADQLLRSASLAVEDEDGDRSGV